MTCKCLTTKFVIIPGGSEVGGPITPQSRPMPECKLRRQPDDLFWPTKCNETPSDGPCWFWIEEHGSQSDLDFQKC